MSKNKTKTANILRFYPFTKGYRLKFIISVLAALVAVVGTYMTPQVIKITVDSVIGDIPFNLPGFVVSAIDSIGGREMLRTHIIICALVTLAFAALSGISTYISRMSLARACEGSAARIRNTLFSHIQKLPFAWHNSNHTGDIIQRCTMDVDLIRRFVSDQFLEVVRTILLLVVSLVLMYSMNVQLALVVTCFLPVLLVSSLYFYVKTGKKFRFADEKEGELTSVVQENLTGVRVVRAFGRERFEIERFKKFNQEFSDLWMKLGKLMCINWSSGDFLVGIQVVTIIVVGVFFVIGGSLTEGEYLAFTAYNGMLVWPTRNLGRLLGDLSKTTISSARLFEILDAEEEKGSDLSLTPPMDGDIVFDNVSFGYTDSSNVLRDISFTIKAGTTFGILGATGSGKSTLTYLLDRLYVLSPENGKITISGVDINDIDLSYMRKNIGIVLQEPFLFSKSFRESISDGSDLHDIESVKRYADIAVIDDAIESFSQGYETPIGERGVTISGGQKQRVAIARMLMQDTPIKVFDDSLSAVDMETDAKIRKSINEKVDGTTILIAHRITTIMNADMIMVLDKGRISQMGTHSELINQDGIYKRIYDTQKASGGNNSAQSSQERSDK